MSQNLSVCSTGAAGQGDEVLAPSPSQAANGFPSAFSRCPAQVPVADFPSALPGPGGARPAGCGSPSSSQGLL